eukprot:370959-Alexandrium_andersonii.AAC.1
MPQQGEATLTALWWWRKWCRKLLAHQGDAKTTASEPLAGKSKPASPKRGWSGRNCGSQPAMPAQGMQTIRF